MRIRPPEFETSICDAKYHVSLSTRSVLGKCVYLSSHKPPPWPPPPPPSSSENHSGQLDEENPSVQISSGLLVHADKGVSHPVVDLIGVIYRSLP
ncbi:hypothetical protein F511_36728 [Dorcoceras hygrometricum]|uniref:Uncharacterized protein n=1 Tax=Dorcoceras hygrometricum TaxID=472368 RepID=A0A2Z7B4C2_9LAMI|nr:hypothetical protein F511_36728 [Dorcoceras hygrometricum]